jgi:hypothetical protein
MGLWRALGDTHRQEIFGVLAMAESLTVVFAGLVLLGLGLLYVTNQPWFRRLTASSHRRRRAQIRRRRPRPRFRRAA